MEADSSPPQAPATTGKASAAESGERDLFAESPPPVAGGGPERRLAAGLGQTQPTRGQAFSADSQAPAAGPMPPGFEPHHSGGMVENSPAFQRRDSGEREPSPAGTAELDCVSRPCGTYPPGASNPALKRRAIAVCPSGTEIVPETAHPVFQKALEILRREVPPLAQVQSPTPEVQSSEAAIQPPGTERTALLPVPHPELRSKITPALDFRPETLDCAAPPAELRAPHSALPTQILPARMLNEFVYCPRLFYYEFVESVFVESGDTVRGKALHRRVDSGKGDLPPAAEKKSEDRRRHCGTLHPQLSTLNRRSHPFALRVDGFRPVGSDSQNGLGGGADLTFPGGLPGGLQGRRAESRRGWH